jgi:hypothetical protein
MARRKSIRDIILQNYRIQSVTSDPARIDRVASITRRYMENINRAITRQGVPGDPDKKVSRRVYMGLNAG